MWGRAGFPTPLYSACSLLILSGEEVEANLYYVGVKKPALGSITLRSSFIKMLALRISCFKFSRNLRTYKYFQNRLGNYSSYGFNNISQLLSGSHKHIRSRIYAYHVHIFTYFFSHHASLPSILVLPSHLSSHFSAFSSDLVRCSGSTSQS